MSIDESFKPSCIFEEYMKNAILKKGTDGLPKPISRMDKLLWQLCEEISKGGTNGKSAYDIAVENGFVGTESEWLTSLKGDKGDKGDKGEKGVKGDPGVNGNDGVTPVRGKDYWTESDILEIQSYIDSKIAEVLPPTK